MSVIDAAKEFLGIALRPLTWVLKEEIKEELGHKKGHGPVPPTGHPPPWFFASKHLKIHPLVQIAGLSGAAACALAGWGNNYFKDREDVSAHRKFAFESANRVHMINSAVLLAVPQSNRPYITGCMFTIGSCLFCGSYYHYALTGSEEYLQLVRYGGCLTIIAWLSMIF